MSSTTTPPTDPGRPAWAPPGWMPAPPPTDPRAALSVRGLVKFFGARCAVAGIDLDVPVGSLFGLVGPNGAGKTTLFRVLAGLERPQAGTVRVGGAVGSRVPAADLGFLPEEAADLPRLTPRQACRLDAALRGLELTDAQIDAQLGRLGAAGFADTPTRRLSQGMAKRSAIARALLGEPDVVVLDEPLNALDVATVIALKEELRRCRERGAAVLLSSHVLDLVDESCSRVVLLDRGRVVETVDVTGGRGTAERAYRRLFG
mgnify:CR=1 FL=1